MAAARHDPGSPLQRPG